MIDAILNPKNRFTWSLLAFQGGYVNVGGFLSIHLFVSHITGFSAHFGLAVTTGNWLRGFYFLLVPIFFLVGAFYSSIFTELKKMKKEKPTYFSILALLASIYFAVSVLGFQGQFGEFGKPFEDFRDFILLSTLSFSCGAQNALFTTYSNSIIRTTHLTGITTDLGVGLAKALISKDKRESRINRIRMDLILYFLIGSLTGAMVFPAYKFISFLLPASLSLVIGIQLLRNNDTLKH